MRTHDFKSGKFWGIAKVRWGSPFRHTAPVRTVDPPYWTCEKATHTRIAGKIAFVRGEWKDTEDSIDDHLMKAVTLKYVEA